jgi:hypothetical protein
LVQRGSGRRDLPDTPTPLLKVYELELFFGRALLSYVYGGATSFEEEKAQRCGKRSGGGHLL